MARVTALSGHPIQQYASPNIGGTMAGHRGIVLHIAQGTYRGTIAWQLNPDQRYADGTRVTTSSTWVVGREPGEWAQMVDSSRVAWCQRGGSLDWLSIELAGYAPDAPSVWQVAACAQLLVWAHRTHGVPLAVAADPSGRGLGHHSMDREWLGEEWGHDACPGAGVIAAKGAIVATALSILEEDDMALTDRDADYLIWRVEALIRNRPAVAGGAGAGEVNQLHMALAALAARPPVEAAPVDLDALVAALAPLVDTAAEAAVRRVMLDAGTGD